MLVPMGNTHGLFHEGGGKTHIGRDDDCSGRTLCGINACSFFGPDDGINEFWIHTGGNELCNKCAKSALRILLEDEAAKRKEGEKC